MNPKPGSGETFTLAKRWLSDCREGHQGCPEPALKFMPRTILKVSRVSGESEYQVLLFFTKDLEAKQPYLALSYY